jgi:hypothetical protein
VCVCVCVCVCVSLSLLDNPVKMFPRQGKSVGSVVFYVVPVVSKENRRLVLPRTTTSLMHNFQIDSGAHPPSSATVTGGKAAGS